MLEKCKECGAKSNEKECAGFYEGGANRAGSVGGERKRKREEFKLEAKEGRKCAPGLVDQQLSVPRSDLAVDNEFPTSSTIHSAISLAWITKRRF